MSKPLTLFEKIWNEHLVAQEPGVPAVLYIDLQLIHEVTSPQAFSDLRARNLQLRQPARTVATVDHAIPTLPGADGSVAGRLAHADDLSRKQIAQWEANTRDFGITAFGPASDHNGIVHVVGPEMGFTQPGMTIVCGDSHTSTHGAFGALAFGIGTSEVEHVLATQCLLQNKPKTFEVRVEGDLPFGVTAKDIILALIAKIGVSGGIGYVLEYSGSAIRALDMEGRMTVCNMSIEAGARAGLIAPDQVTFDYLADRPNAPKGAEWESALARWKTLPSDPGAEYDRTITIDAASLKPMITFGTNPGMGITIDGRVPSPDEYQEPDQKAGLEKALSYMGLTSGQPIMGQPIEVVFIGSCTNGRISDLRQAAQIMKGRKVAAGVRTLVVPGSVAVKAQAEAEGLDKIFTTAGAEWRLPGCSMCIAMNGDQIEAGQYAVSTSNRNFEGRQGKGGRTLLASPLTAAAAAVTGRVTDPRTLMTES
ncbi:MAG: 3-isopropylmalate dehydratase large subunit [Anaerolineaceae bacterium]|nr:3-isopropylmalate dehydratase large subunit [Anaerolineaceae bacterium]